ncbi:GDSL esterase/lipase At3g43570-like [Carex rostrata]
METKFLYIFLLLVNVSVLQSNAAIPQVPALIVLGDSITDPAFQHGIKEYLPAYLDPKLSDEELLTGVSFASAGAGFDNISAQIASAYSMWDQLQMFKEYKIKIETVAGIERAAKIVSDSIYIRLSRSNDIMTSYFTTNIISNYDIPSYVNYLIQAASSFKKGLIDEATRGCCGSTGEIEATLSCNELSPCTCEDASKYVFWDA